MLLCPLCIPLLLLSALYFLLATLPGMSCPRVYRYPLKPHCPDTEGRMCEKLGNEVETGEKLGSVGNGGKALKLAAPLVGRGDSGCLSPVINPMP